MMHHCVTVRVSVVRRSMVQTAPDPNHTVEYIELAKVKGQNR